VQITYRSASVFALESSELASISAKAFWEILGRHPEVSAIVLKNLASQLRDVSNRLYEFTALAVKNRIHAELLRLAKQNMVSDDQAVISPAPTHTEIASRISTHRVAVTREFSELARMGIVERNQRKLVIRDVTRLARLVHEVLGEDASHEPEPDDGDACHQNR